MKTAISLFLPFICLLFLLKYVMSGIISCDREINFEDIIVVFKGYPEDEAYSFKFIDSFSDDPIRGDLSGGVSDVHEWPFKANYLVNNKDTRYAITYLGGVLMSNTSGEYQTFNNSIQNGVFRAYEGVIGTNKYRGYIINPTGRIITQEINSLKPHPEYDFFLIDTRTVNFEKIKDYSFNCSYTEDGREVWENSGKVCQHNTYYCNFAGYYNGLVLIADGWCRLKYQDYDSNHIYGSGIAFFPKNKCIGKPKGYSNIFYNAVRASYDDGGDIASSSGSINILFSLLLLNLLIIL